MPIAISEQEKLTPGNDGSRASLATQSLNGDSPFGSLIGLPNGFSALNHAKSTMVKDSEQDAIEKLANDLNVKLDEETKDYLMQYYLNEHSNQSAYDRSMQASNTQYQRAVEDLRKAGLNPFLALQSLGGSAPTSSGSSVQGGLYTSRKNAQTQADASSGARVAASIMSLLGMIAVAVIAAL